MQNEDKYEATSLALMPIWKIICPSYYGNIYHYLFSLFYPKDPLILIEEISEILPYKKISKFVKTTPLLISYQWTKISIPIQKNPSKRLKDTKIFENNWKRYHFNAISSAYNSSPFFFAFKDEIRAIYQKKYVFLIDFIFAIREFFISTLKTILAKHSSNICENNKQIIPNFQKFSDIKEEQPHRLFLENIHINTWPKVPFWTSYLNHLSILHILSWIGNEIPSLFYQTS